MYLFSICLLYIESLLEEKDHISFLITICHHLVHCTYWTFDILVCLIKWIFNPKTLGEVGIVSASKRDWNNSGRPVHLCPRTTIQDSLEGVYNNLHDYHKFDYCNLSEWFKVDQVFGWMVKTVFLNAIYSSTCLRGPDFCPTLPIKNSISIFRILF